MCNFYWPDINSDIKRYCDSCDACQRMVQKGRTKPAPLGGMPLVDTPFKRVTIDIICRISAQS